MAVSKRYEYTPQMRDYDAMKDPAHRNYVPYLMYFHRTNFESPSVTTDGSGFRRSTGADGVTASAAGAIPPGPVGILAGGSSALGVGASDDSHTLASLLWRRYASSLTWLNFGSYCFNPAQEVLLLTLYRHLLGQIDEIVILSGANAAIMARLPEWQQGDHGAFFFCNDYWRKMSELQQEAAPTPSRRRRPRPPVPAGSTVADLRRDATTVIASATEMTRRQLDIWRRVAGPETRVSYVLQPVTRWMPYEYAPEEKALFDEYDAASDLGPWDDAYADIASTTFARAFADSLESACADQGVDFLDLNPVIAERATASDWLFVDRVHYNDKGHDLVARTMAEALKLS